MLSYPSPDDPAPRTHTLRLALSDGTAVAAVSDPYSDRLRCDHPAADTDGLALADSLIGRAEALGCGRVVVLAPPSVADDMGTRGFEHEATLPGFYAGARDCAVLRLALDDERSGLVHPKEVARVDALLGAHRDPRD